MPFNFIAHHSCRHCSGYLFYSNGKCYGEEEGGWEVKERTCSGASVESSLGTGCKCGRAAPAPQGATSREENSGAVLSWRETSDKNTKHPLRLQF